MYTIDISNSKVKIIHSLTAKYEGENHQTPVWFKKTAEKFKKQYGFELIGAPIIFKADGMIWKLSFIQSNYPAHLGGRKWEKAEYLPIIGCGKFFDRLKLKS